MADNEQKPLLTAHSDTSGVISVLLILALVVVAGFIAYRVFATPTLAPTAPTTNNGAPTTSEQQTGSTTSIDLEATTTTP